MNMYYIVFHLQTPQTQRHTLICHTWFSSSNQFSPVEFDTIYFRATTAARCGRLLLMAVKNSLEMIDEEFFVLVQPSIAFRSSWQELSRRQAMIMTSSEIGCRDRQQQHKEERLIARLRQRALTNSSPNEASRQLSVHYRYSFFLFLSDLFNLPRVYHFHSGSNDEQVELFLRYDTKAALVEFTRSDQ